ncbi:MAG: DNA-3-methyladenine glycosylase I [Bacilli bacterium]|nr:DNA-3-methyladenine glycosylase I [Bacilli bacterium]
MENGCCWGYIADPAMKQYHDEVWGKPTHDEHELFRMLVLESFQAGLSWKIVYAKREAIGKALADFDPIRLSNFTEFDVQGALDCPNMIKSPKKIASAINNAKRFLEVEREFGSFDAYIWSFTDGKPIDHRLKSMEDMPAKSELSDRISADLKKRGFNFVGSVIVYSYLQAIGIVNDHLIGCPNR